MAAGQFNFIGRTPLYRQSIINVWNCSPFKRKGVINQDRNRIQQSVGSHEKCFRSSQFPVIVIKLFSLESANLKSRINLDQIVTRICCLVNLES